MTPSSPDPVLTTAGVMMTLSAISYQQPVTPAAFIRQLNNPAYATGANWQLVWGPAYEKQWDNVVYIVQHVGTSDYAVAIRGTDYTPLGLDTLGQAYEDLNVGRQPAFGFGSPNGACVATGTLQGLTELTDQVGATQTRPTAYPTLLEFLQEAKPANLYVTGHSLGGCLATVLAPWIKFQLQQSGTLPQAIYAYTFAAPSAGNQQFADWYTGNAGITSYRYYNSIDLVPMAWASLANVKSLFSANLSCGIGMKLVVDGITAWLTNRDEVTYVQPNGQGTPLNNSSIVTDDWFQEIGAQHDTNLYLRLLGAPPLLP